MDNVKKMQFTFDSKIIINIVPEATHLSDEIKDLITKILVPA